MRKLIFTLVFLTAGIHILFTGLYLAPINPLTNSYKKVVYSYMSPVFNQNWRLFSPEPSTSSLKMWYQCEDRVPWKDPTSKLLKLHYSNRISYLGKLNYVYQGLFRNVYNSYINLSQNCGKGDNKCVESQLKKKQDYKNLVSMVKQLCLKDNNPTNNINVKILNILAKDFSKRNTLERNKLSAVSLVIK